MTPRIQNLLRSLMLVFGWLALCSIPKTAKAQVLLQDSLALVAFYNSTNGPGWDDNTGWLVDPVNAWTGVILDGTGNRVIGLDLPMNNLQGIVPIEIANLTMFEVLNVENNALQFIPDLTGIPSFNTFMAANNALQFDTFEPYFLGGIPLIPTITIMPQAMVGQPLDTIVYVDSQFVLQINVAGDDNQYQWFQNNTLFTGGTPLPDGALLLDPIVGSNDGTYTCVVSNNEVPGLFIENFPNILNICQFDSLGGRFKPNQLIIQWDSTATDTEKDTMRNFFSANYVDSVLCGNIELWGIPDTVFLSNGDTLFTIEEVNARSKAKSKIEEVDFNYVSDIERITVRRFGEFNFDSFGEKGGGSPKNNSTLGDTVIVGIIDTGVDYLHPSIAPFIWNNPLESLNNLDDDGNCIPDDIRGYNFVSKSHETMDDNSHGTHVAGLILSGLTATSKVRLITCKTHDEKGGGDIFRIISAIYYAGSKGADIINISSGYSGEAAAILENAISDVWKNGTIIVASAGNLGINNDTLGHYPSGYTLPNIVSVAALDQSTGVDSLAFFSNFGQVSVDLAAPGLDVMSTLPNDSFGTKSGTSMSAGIVSNALTRMIEINPVAERLNVINCLLANVDLVANLDTFVVTGGKLNLANALVCSNALLDLDLLSFDADRISDNSVILNWTTANETGFTHFELERRYDDENAFQSIAIIESAGISSGADYLYHDDERFLGTIYYRLKIVNADGSFDYSEIRVIDPIRESTGFWLYPNPSTNDLFLEIGEINHEIQAEVQIYNSLGVLLSSTKNQVRSKETIQMDIEFLNDGAYFLIFKFGENTRTFKFIKMEK
ncbi:MAG: S8 family serine peptidase [Bacteroidota bacterium]